MSQPNSPSPPPFDRAAHCRAIAAKGGQATAQKHGRRHMQRIGRRGWETTTARYFAASPALHLAWLKTAGAFNYFSSTGLQLKTDATGRAIWPTEPPAHPAQFVARGQRGLFETTVVTYHPLPF